MNQKIQLSHPAGKKAVSIDKDKYDILKKALLSFLREKGESTHQKIFQVITEEFKKNKIKFDGSVQWHLEWVILDLEARKEIKKSGDKTAVKYSVS